MVLVPDEAGRAPSIAGGKSWDPPQAAQRAETCRIAHKARHAWGDRDLDAVLAELSEDVVLVLDVDGLPVPHCVSAASKAQLRAKL